MMSNFMCTHFPNQIANSLTETTHKNDTRRNSKYKLPNNCKIKMIHNEIFAYKDL